jgi:CheY-like chemotaxis protein
MQPDDIYALTRQGEEELHSSSTQLPRAALDLLVRFDGVLTLDQVMRALPPEATAGFGATFRTLRDRGLLEQVRPDPFTLQWQADLNNIARSVGNEEADAGLASLQRAGFYVQIARERVRPAKAPGGTLTAVVVEDDEALARFTNTLLSLMGFTVRQAGNRAEVVASIRRAPVPDLILLDVMLPDADGFDILRRVRAHPALVEVPVIMLTGKATREAVLHGLSLGADGYITKPATPDAVMRAVRTVMGMPEEGDGQQTWTGHAPR